MAAPDLDGPGGGGGGGGWAVLTFCLGSRKGGRAARPLLSTVTARPEPAGPGSGVWTQAGGGPSWPPGKWVLPLFCLRREKLRPRTSHNDRLEDPRGSPGTHAYSVPLLSSTSRQYQPPCPEPPRGPPLRVKAHRIRCARGWGAGGLGTWQTEEAGACFPR